MRTLQALGYVEAEEPNGFRYRITDKGRQALAARKAAQQQAGQPASSPSAP